MSIGYRFFTINIRNNDVGAEQLNGFLRTVSVVSVCKEFVADGGDSFWSICVEYMEMGKGAGDGVKPAKSKVDYKKVLSPGDFTLFAKLRDWRRVVAGEAAIPLYNIMNNEQLAKLAQNRPVTKAELTAIEGIGEGRAGKYGEAVLAIIDEYIKKQDVASDEKAG